MELELFRIKVFGPSPRSMFDDDFVPSEVLRRAIIERPTSRPRRGVRWHIGNVERLDEDGYYFRIGRQTRSTFPQLDAGTGNFVESEFESAPYTHALVDVRLELCGIAKNFALAPRVEAISRRLVEVLNASEAARDTRASFAIGALSDPDAFITLLQSAHSIRSYTFTFQRRNPFDANEMFVQPFERLVEETNASVGQATVKGIALEEAPLEAITRSAAATGDDARARLLINPDDAKSVVRTLRGSNVAIGADNLDTNDDRLAALNRTRAEYQRIRRGDDR